MYKILKYNITQYVIHHAKFKSDILNVGGD